MSKRTFRNESRDDYLEAILLIRQRKGYCRSTDIASELAEQGLIRFDKEKLLHFTDQGQAIAEMTYSKHMFFKRCLQSMGIDEVTADREACAIEHTISDASFNKIVSHVSACKG